MSPLRIWFAVATFACSALIFWVEPLIGKQLLPLAGGAPAVWNVCLLFFQTALLIGYAGAHGLTRIRSPRVQAALFLATAAAAFLLLPISFAGGPDDPSRPVQWLLGQLTIQLLLPFVVLAAAAPLLQHWYSRTPAAGAEDPYFLYASSNAGSLIALLSFPVLLEPSLGIASQNRIWMVFFAVAVAVAAGTASRARMAVPAETHLPVPGTAGGGRPAARQLATWALLAAVPSGMLLAVTTFITADLAPVPLLWVVPLALYLGTFIAAFGWFRDRLPDRFERLVIVAAVLWALLHRIRATDPLWLLLLVHLGAFTVLSLGAHARLARLRPPPAYLTTYYLAVSAGGALGGAAVALLAPQLFDSYLEYPLLVVAAVLLNLWHGERPDLRADIVPAVLLAVGIALLFQVTGENLSAIVLIALPAVAAYLMSGRTIRFVLALIVVLVSARLDGTGGDRVLHAERNFYGLLRVVSDEDNRYHELLHGTTLHGAMALGQPQGSEPLSYYWVGSPVAEVIREVQARRDGLDVGAVGLGVGALAWYAQPDERWTYYEINPAVADLAGDPRWFEFLERSRAERMDVVLGDARLMLRDAPDGAYDLLILDAFTSDAVPLHLLTQEALALYERKLAPGGLMIFHVSNRYLDLPSPIAAVGETLGLEAFLRLQTVTDEQAEARISSSGWLVLAREGADFPLPLGDASGWYPIRPRNAPIWTDDYSNIWRVFIRS